MVPTLLALIEILVFDQMNEYFEVNKFVSSQFAFLSSMSTLDALDSLMCEVSSTFETKNFAWATLCDLKEVSDHVK